MKISRPVLFFVALALGIFIGNFLTSYSKDKEFDERENARADVVALLYEEKTKRNQDSISYNQIINQAAEKYYELLENSKAK